MKIKFIIILSLITNACSYESSSYEQILFSRVRFATDTKEFNESIEEVKRLDLLLSLDSIESMNSFKALINENYCDDIFFIQLSEISERAYLPISYYCNEIIDINIKDVTIVKTVEDVKDSTSSHKIVAIDTKDLEIFELKKIVNEIALDYKLTLIEETGKPVEDLVLTEMKQIIVKAPLFVMII